MECSFEIPCQSVTSGLYERQLLQGRLGRSATFCSVISISHWQPRWISQSCGCYLLSSHQHPSFVRKSSAPLLRLWAQHVMQRRPDLETGCFPRCYSPAWWKTPPEAVLMAVRRRDTHFCCSFLKLNLLEPDTVRFSCGGAGWGC